MLARACGKTNVHSLEPEDLCALTVEAAAMAKVPLAGTTYVPGVSEEATLGEIKGLLEVSTLVLVMTALVTSLPAFRVTRHQPGELFAKHGE